jgi:hypothetical protein
MNRTTLLAATLLGATLSSTALAGVGGEASVELGNLQNHDDAYTLFSDGVAMPSRGIRGGVRVADRFTVLAGWHRVQRGATVFVAAEGSDRRFHAAFFADEFTLGLKADLDVAHFFYPYATVQGMLLRGVMKFDDDERDDEEDPSQIKASAVAPGALLMGGMEFRIPQGSWPLTAAWHVEAGYGLVASADYGAFGTMRPGGFALRTGLGVRF